MIDFILRPIRRRFGKDRKFYAAIDDMFGFIPHNIELYKLALIHKSASVTLDDGRQINNERLEFLGDAVIESVTSDYLFIEFPDQNEGFLTQLRSKMVSRQSLNEVAKRLKLDTHVITHSSASFSQKHIYGDAFEAMMGAIYLDQGYDFVNRLLINRIFGDYLRTGALLEEETDFKSRLIEWCQKNHHTIRFITSHDRSYSSSHPVFICKVLIDDIEAGYGSGDSKKEAEQHAAFSVSQGFREEDCAKLFDRLDAIERGLAPQRPQRRKDDQDDPDEDTRNTAGAQNRKTDKSDNGDGDNRENTGQNSDPENTESEPGAAKSTGRSRSSRRARRRAAAAAADNAADTVTDGQTAVAEEDAAEKIEVNAPETISDQAVEDSTSATDAESVSTPDNDLPDAEKSDNSDAEPILTAAEPAAEKPSENIPAENTQTEHQEAETATEEGVQSELSDDTSTTSEQNGAGRSRSRRSRRKAAAQTTEPEVTQQDSTTEKAESSAESDNADTASEQAAEKAATPKRRSRRRTKAAVTEAEIFEVSAMEITEPAPETAPSENSETAAESVAEAKEAATPKRHPRRRQSKSAKASSEKNSGNTAENTTEGVASAEDGNGGMTEEVHTESDNTNAAQQSE